MPGSICVEEFDDGDLGPKPPPDAAELEPDHAAADHDHVLQEPLASNSSAPVESTTIALVVINVDAGERGDAGAGGDDDVLGADAAVADLQPYRPTVNAARPFSQSTLFFLNRNSMPPVSCLTASTLRCSRAIDRGRGSCL